MIADTVAVPRQSRPARLWRRVWVAAIVVWLALLIAFMVDLAYSRHELTGGLDQIRTTKATITTARLENDPLATLNAAEAGLLQAQGDFRRADQGLAPLAPVLSRLGWVPTYGPELAQASPAARLAHDSTDAAVEIVAGLQPLRAHISGLHGRAGTALPMSQLVAAIARGRSHFAAACTAMTDAGRARTSLAHSSSPVIRDALRSFDHEAPTLEIACRVLFSLPKLLGYPNPYRYIVGYEDPLQIRATGGFLGTAGLLTMKNGHASQRFISTWIDDNLSVPPPEPMQLYDREPGWLLRDSNWSPDFPTSASLERFFARLDLGWRAPALVNLTPRVVADTLTALGPFYSPEYHRQITGANVTQLTDYYTHHATSFFGPLALKDAATRRKQFIQIVASHLFERVRSLRPGMLVRLARQLAPDIASGDLRFNFTDPSLQSILELAHASGAVDARGGDYLYLVDSNLSYNKINPYIHVRVGYTAHIQHNRWIHSQLTLRFHNTQGPADAYDEAAGPGAGTSGGPMDYADYVRILVPAGSAIVSTSGWTQPWSPGPAYGREVLAGYLIVPVNTTRTVRIRYLIPPNVFSWSRGRRYRLLVQRQPGMDIDRFSATIFDGEKRIAQTTKVGPTGDWSLHTPIVRRAFSPIPLSASQKSRPVVAPGQLVEPHAYLGRPH